MNIEKIELLATCSQMTNLTRFPLEIEKHKEISVIFYVFPHSRSAHVATGPKRDNNAQKATTDNKLERITRPNHGTTRYSVSKQRAADVV